MFVKKNLLRKHAHIMLQVLNIQFKPKNNERSIRRKAKKFSLKHGDIHYTRTNGSEVSFEH